MFSGVERRIPQRDRHISEVNEDIPSVVRRPALRAVSGTNQNYPDLLASDRRVPQLYRGGPEDVRPVPYVERFVPQPQTQVPRFETYPQLTKIRDVASSDRHQPAKQGEDPRIRHQPDPHISLQKVDDRDLTQAELSARLIYMDLNEKEERDNDTQSTKTPLQPVQEGTNYESSRETHTSTSEHDAKLTTPIPRRHAQLTAATQPPRMFDGRYHVAGSGHQVVDSGRPAIDDDRHVVGSGRHMVDMGPPGRNMVDSIRPAFDSGHHVIDSGRHLVNSRHEIIDSGRHVAGNNYNLRNVQQRPVWQVERQSGAVRFYDPPQYGCPFPFCDYQPDAFEIEHLDSMFPDEIWEVDCPWGDCSPPLSPCASPVCDSPPNYPAGPCGTMPCGGAVAESLMEPADPLCPPGQSWVETEVGGR